MTQKKRESQRCEVKICLPKEAQGLDLLKQTLAELYAREVERRLGEMELSGEEKQRALDLLRKKLQEGQGSCPA